MTPGSNIDIQTRPKNQGEQLIVLSENLKQMNTLLNEIKCSVDTQEDTMHKFYTEYKVEHTRVADAAASAHKRIDKVEVDISLITSNMTKIQEAMSPLISSNKFLVWIGAGLGVLLLGFLWAIFTNQIQVIMP